MANPQVTFSPGWLGDFLKWVNSRLKFTPSDELLSFLILWQCYEEKITKQDAIFSLVGFGKTESKLFEFLVD
jgi:hypothetical protein